MFFLRIVPDRLQVTVSFMNLITERSTFFPSAAVVVRYRSMVGTRSQVASLASLKDAKTIRVIARLRYPHLYDDNPLQMKRTDGQQRYSRQRFVRGLSCESTTIGGRFGKGGVVGWKILVLRSSRRYSPYIRLYGSLSSESEGCEYGQEISATLQRLKFEIPSGLWQLPLDE